MSLRVEEIRGPTKTRLPTHAPRTTHHQHRQLGTSPKHHCPASPIAMPNNSLFITVLVLVCYSGCCAAFGAGNIPSVAFLEGKAFRHGDIEDILTELLIRAASSNISTGFGAKSSGKKFSELNVKRTYFGNWL